MAYEIPGDLKGRAIEILKEVLLAALAPFPKPSASLLDFEARAAHLVST
jgi:hypothetical protein